MINDKTVAVVVPAYNEETQIGIVIENMPNFVDRIIVINDCSKDKTSDVVQKYIQDNNRDYSHPKIKKTELVKTLYNHADFVVQEIFEKEKNNLTSSEIANEHQEKDRIILINHKKNGGVGAAVATGFQWCRENNIDITAKVDGDGQMDPAELYNICKPVAEENIDYVKGNRLIHKSSKLVIPEIRYLGNSVLSIMTKIASGYWAVSDTQTAFTAISRNGLNSIRLDKLYKKYGYPNDILVKLNIASCTLKEVEIKPIYNVGEKSKMKILKLIPRLSFLLFKSFFKRLFVKYFFRDFHPLFFFYILSFLLFLIDIPFIVELIKNYTVKGAATQESWLIIFIFLTISSLQSLFFAMWMDIQDNEKLYKR
ncbi:MAG: glycosyltransferase family 2 protein [Bacteroidales bacterium]|nr:glycosyltransferase family 2 protein [Bacteroidales bacterium]